MSGMQVNICVKFINAYIVHGGNTLINCREEVALVEYIVMLSLRLRNMACPIMGNDHIFLADFRFMSKYNSSV